MLTRWPRPSLRRANSAAQAPRVPRPAASTSLIGTLDTEHHEILAACEAQDPARAVRVIRNHLGQTVAHVTDDLEHAKPDSAQPVT